MQVSGRGFQTKSERNVSGKSPTHVSAALIIQLCVMHGTHSQQRLSKYWAQGTAFQGLYRTEKRKKKRERERLTFWSQILSLLENVHSCLVNQRIFWEKN